MNRRTPQWFPFAAPGQTSGTESQNLPSSEDAPQIRRELLTRVLDFLPVSSPERAYPQEQASGVDLRSQHWQCPSQNPIIAASGTFGYGVEFARSRAFEPVWAESS